MDVGLIIAAGGVVLTVLGYRLGLRTERRNSEKDRQDHRPRLDVQPMPQGHAQLRLEHQGGPVVDEVEVRALDALPSTVSAGQLMQTGRGTAVSSLTLPGPFGPGDSTAVRVALGGDGRGTSLRLRVTCRNRRPRRWWMVRPPTPDEWVETMSVTFHRPASIHSPVGVRIPTQTEVTGRRR